MPSDEEKYKAKGGGLSSIEIIICMLNGIRIAEDSSFEADDKGDQDEFLKLLEILKRNGLIVY